MEKCLIWKTCPKMLNAEFPDPWTGVISVSHLRRLRSMLTKAPNISPAATASTSQSPGRLLFIACRLTNLLARPPSRAS